MVSKRRSDHKLSRLNAEQEQKLWDWLNTPGMNYRMIVGLIADEFGISTSTRALSIWWEDRVQEEESERILRATGIADQLGERLSEKLPEVTQALKAQLTQKAFELSLAGGDIKEVALLMDVVGDIMSGELSSSKVELETEKFKQRIREYEEKNAKAKEALEGVKSKGGLTEETIKAIEMAAGLL